MRIGSFFLILLLGFMTSCATLDPPQVLKPVAENTSKYTLPDPDSPYPEHLVLPDNSLISTTDYGFLKTSEVSKPTKPTVISVYPKVQLPAFSLLQYAPPRKFDFPVPVMPRLAQQAQETLSGTASSATLPTTTEKPKVVAPVPKKLIPEVPKASEKTKAPAAPVPELLPQSIPDQGDLNYQDINAKVGDEVFLQFPKANWVYLDSSDSQQKAGFIESRREMAGTSFLFKPKIIGTYFLSFQRQDLEQGTQENRKVRLVVVSKDSRVATNSTPLSAKLAPDSKQTPYESAKENQNKGKLPEAVKTLLADYKPNDTKANWEIGKILSDENQPSEALKYLERNLGAFSPELSSSLTLATKLGAQNPELNRLPVILPIWSQQNLIPPENLFLDSLESLAKSKKLQDGLTWSDNYDSWYPIPTQRDRLLYWKAQILESPGAQRNVREALSLYQNLIDSYPLSQFWTTAGQRLAALKRQLINVR